MPNIYRTNICKCPRPFVILQPKPGNNPRPTGSLHIPLTSTGHELTLVQASDGSGSLVKLRSVHTRSSEIPFLLRLQNVREQKCQAHSSKFSMDVHIIFTYEDESIQSNLTHD